MNINYDPDKIPELSSDLSELASKLNYHIVNVICVELSEKVVDGTGVNFFAMTPFLPRPGDEIKLEDGKYCSVQRVFFGVTRIDGQLGLVPNVIATLLENE